MKITHISYSDGRGGAAIATYRLHRAMIEYGLDSTLIVRKKTRNDSTVVEIPPTKFEKKFYKRLNRILLAKHHTQNSTLRSLNLTPTRLLRFINEQKSDIVHLHWINDITLSIRQVTKINKPIIWSQPDMWLINGCEHYILNNDPPRYEEGYNKTNRPLHESGIDLNRYIWNYKKYFLSKRNFPIICSSNWLSNCTKSSPLFHSSNIYTIPDLIDRTVFKPQDPLKSRGFTNLPQDKYIILFAAINAAGDKRKGYNYILELTKLLSNTPLKDKVCLAILGTKKSSSTYVNGIQQFSLGYTWDDKELSTIYNSCDALLIPSESDNFPNIVKEATCCGIPTIAFATSGLIDMVDHKFSGYLATPFHTNDLLNGIKWAYGLNRHETTTILSEKGKNLYDHVKCVKKHILAYSDTLL